jgi:uncharacterized repeat protein (TIGR03803 family)
LGQGIEEELARHVERFSQLWTVASAAAFATGLGSLSPAVAAHGFHVLHSFCHKAGCRDGGSSPGGITLDGSENLVGPGSGGRQNGVIFSLSPGKRGLDTVYRRVHNFCARSCKDGFDPEFPLIRDAAGNFYSTATEGGARGGGTIFELTPEDGRYKLRVLHAFANGDSKTGFSPASGLTYQGAAFGQTYDGVSPLYGTTSQGGAQNGGTVYSFVPGRGRVKALHSFCDAPCGDGMLPTGGLTLDSDGSVFGTTFLGGANSAGTVFRLSPADSKFNYSVIYSFCSLNSCTDGTQPDAGVTLDSARNLFGTTVRNGEHDEGTVFELSPSGSNYAFRVLYQFTGQTDGGAPQAPLAVDAFGNLFGTGVDGGNLGGGVVFELSPGSEGWSQTTLHSFCSTPGCTDGASPKSPLTLDSSGRLYGATVGGGANGSGVVFELQR